MGIDQLVLILYFDITFDQPRMRCSDPEAEAAAAVSASEG